MPDGTILTTAEARHLLRRTGFGAPAAQVAAIVGANRTRGDVVAEMLAAPLQDFSPGGSSQAKQHDKWVKFLLKAKFPLQEKLVLFWHDHFATGVSKVQDYATMARQNQLLRRNAKGNFRVLMKAMNTDPAMTEFLDTVRNEKAIPNENYARELQELFTLGVKDEAGNDNYTQADIVQIARAFTGWGRSRKRPAFYSGRHDFNAEFEGAPENRGPKDIYKTTGGFGATGGRFAGTGSPYEEGETEIDTIIDIILEHRDTDGKVTVARRLARRLIEYFAHPDPSLAFIDAVVTLSSFDTSWSIADLLHQIFVHDDFYLTAQPAGAGTKKSVKWPIDLVVTTLRLLKVKPNGSNAIIRGGDFQRVYDHLTNMGQVLFDPPSVFGWDWESAWLSSATLLARYSFANDVASSQGQSLRLEKLLDLTNTSADAGDVVDAITDLLGMTDDLLPGDRAVLIDYLTDGSPGATVNLTSGLTRDKKLAGVVGLVLQSPAYQVH